VSPRSVELEISLRKSGIGLLPWESRQGNGGRATAGAKDVMTSVKTGSPRRLIAGAPAVPH
ncbi:MAG: hypothetical protein ACRD36_09745, partial [Candidatus Acidiferrum sp.]